MIQGLRRIELLLMFTLKRKLRLPLFWVNLLIDVATASIFIVLASFADELKIIGYEGSAALLILAAVAVVVVAFITVLGVIQRPFGLSLSDYFRKKDW
ncbi:hypothetical protein [Rhizobium sp. MHM7A]|uniref:hypothetical protein n=1 Tax=Rhizobium sp. MHM7A TaxID=2583233 RepID=UPI0011058158|nr:hypothetical protein [Rhizobium sp. MHM7A]TLX16015.1 hypothetical protein FFR93_01470 [Rhizobium sp. MHM7A]